MRERPKFFGLVREEGRKRWNQLDDDKELGGAWWLLFRQIQNPRHVLSELLQNADDSGATEAFAGIEDGCFVFRHNGHDFSEEEFRSLCRFGFSNKRRSLTIGFRGIGFKSVFSLGPSAQILTPTLAFRFDRKRFTQPEWIDTDEATEHTVIRVRIESPEKEAAIRAQIDNWIKSAIPLLFFQSIRTLRLFDREIHVDHAGAGPCGNSQLATLSGSVGTVTVFRSGEEEFPQECLSEVRTERNEDITLPPCDVVVFLGATQQQRLYCVLPTEVTVALPFSCQAPFIQDPARTGIKDPSTSPTNTWLLDRIGALAAESLLAWLRRDDKDAADRAKAYDLLPELAPVNTGLLSGIATQRILDAFRRRIEHEKLLLCADGTLDDLQHTARLPGAAIEAWGADGSRLLFSPDKRSVLAGEIRSGSTSRLEAWKFLAPASFDAPLKALADEAKPAPHRPARLQALAAFWVFAQQHVQPAWTWLDWWRKGAIVPLSGRSYLGRAKDALPSRNCPSGCPLADWQFITERAEILDEGWTALVDQIKDNPAEAARDIGASLGRRVTDNFLAGILDGVRKAKLDQAPTLDQVFEQVAPRIFSKSPPDANEAIRFLQIAAKLNISFSGSAPLKLLCTDGQWRTRADGLLAMSEIDLSYLLPADWLSRHLISAEYEAGLLPHELQTWRLWAANPQKGGLSTFPLPVKSEERLWNLDAIFRPRSVAVPQRKFANKPYLCADRNWDSEIWNHWRQKETDGDLRIWVDVGWAVISSWSSPWERLTRYEVQQFGRNNFHRLDGGDVTATWLHELRNRMCIPDNRGNPRLPADLFRRTPDTLPLLDVEPFVQDRWDLPGRERALDGLGVRTQPTDASKLLDRLRALSLADDPPIGPLRDLYRAIERVLPRLTGDRKTEVRTHSQQSLLSGQRVAGRGVDFVFEIIQAPSPVYRSCIGKFEM